MNTDALARMDGLALRDEIDLIQNRLMAPRLASAGRDHKPPNRPRA
jgi:hypothetical protein